MNQKILIFISKLVNFYKPEENMQLIICLNQQILTIIITHQIQYQQQNINYICKKYNESKAAKNASANQYHINYHPPSRVCDQKCVICCNINFAFRSQSNRCGLISKEQNDHHNTMIAYGECSYGAQGQSQVLPYFLTPLRKKDKDNKIDAGEQEYQPKGEQKSRIQKNCGGLLSVSPVLRQLGL